jgi:hypothetical protein
MGGPTIGLLPENYIARSVLFSSKILGNALEGAVINRVSYKT